MVNTNYYNPLYGQQNQYYNPTNNYSNSYLTPNYTYPLNYINTQSQQNTQPRVQQTPINWVQGEAGAKSFVVTPGQTVLLMDSEESVFYIKSTDESGMPLPLRIFDYKEREEIIKESTIHNEIKEIDMSNYVTHEELENKINSIIQRNGNNGYVNNKRRNKNNESSV